MKTSELTGAALDWVVAKCEGVDAWVGFNHAMSGKCLYVSGPDDKERYTPSTDWAQGGPIIERERIRVEPFSGAWLACIWNEDNGEYHLFYRCPTPLIAAMRCYVASRLGDEIEIPEELK